MGESKPIVPELVNPEVFSGQCREGISSGKVSVPEGTGTVTGCTPDTDGALVVKANSDECKAGYQVGDGDGSLALLLNGNVTEGDGLSAPYMERRLDKSFCVRLNQDDASKFETAEKLWAKGDLVTRYNLMTKFLGTKVAGLELSNYLEKHKDENFKDTLNGFSFMKNPPAEKLKADDKLAVDRAEKIWTKMDVNERYVFIIDVFKTLGKHVAGRDLAEYVRERPEECFKHTFNAVDLLLVR